MDKFNKNFLTAIKGFEYLILIIITIVAIITVGVEVISMVGAQKFTLSEILLLFIYLEVFALIGVFLSSGEFPVRIPLYIGIVALTRYVIIDVKHMEDSRLITIGLLVLMFAGAALLIKICKTRFIEKPN